MAKIKFFVAFAALLSWACGQQGTFSSQTPPLPDRAPTLPAAPLRCGAERLDAYLPMLQGQTVALVVNHTSRVGERHLADTLLTLGVRIKAIFAPEHGFRGSADAGEKISDGKDLATGIPLVSLYGSKRKPSTEDLKGVHRVIFDIQDVGARFYTYISTLHYVMEACAEHSIPLLILDRPNPNGHYVDGPVLEKGFESFVGMHPVPVVHGMTVGEYARMINGEGWLPGKAQCPLEVVPCTGYTHHIYYELPVKPSPNLPDMRSVYLYPSTCFFEGTIASEGRGTSVPFQVYGHPKSGMGDYYFVPQAMPGAANPKLKGQRCRGVSLAETPLDSLRQLRRVDLSHLIQFYKAFPEKDSFFLPSLFFDKLAGNSTLRAQIVAGKTEEEIRAYWQPELKRYRQMRKQYLLYDE